MSNGKAPDELSIKAEHLKNGGPIIATILEQSCLIKFMRNVLFLIFLTVELLLQSSRSMENQYMTQIRTNELLSAASLEKSLKN